VVAGVHSHVLLQIGVLRELSLAYVARHLRTIRRVRVEMTLQRTRADEPPATDGTAERPLARVNPHVFIQSTWLSEPLITQNTL